MQQLWRGAGGLDGCSSVGICCRSVCWLAGWGIASHNMTPRPLLPSVVVVVFAAWGLVAEPCAAPGMLLGGFIDIFGLRRFCVGSGRELAGAN